MADDAGDLEDQLTRRPPPDPNPPEILGWPTKRLIALDALAPGLLRRVLSAAPMTRQAVFAVLALSTGRLPVDDGLLAQTVLNGRAREILRFVFDDVPEGLLGALARIGGEPLARATYYDLICDLFSDPAKRRQARALRHVGQISKLTLDAVTTLDPKWLHPLVLGRAQHLMELQDFQRSIDVLKSMPIPPSDDAIQQAIVSMGPLDTLSSVIVRLIRRAKSFPDHPLAGDEAFRPLDSTHALIVASLKHRNCLRGRVIGPLTGRVAYAEYRGGVALVELKRLAEGRGWLLFEVHGPRNDPLPRETVNEVRAACLARGIPHIDDGRDALEWRSLIRMAENGGLYDWTA